MIKKISSRIALIMAVTLIMTSTFTSCKPKTTSGSESSESAADSSVSSDVSSTEAASAISLAESIPINSSKSSSKPKVVYNSKSVFNSAAKKKESKISINNSKIVAPSIASSAPTYSIVKRTQIEGVDGSFYDANIKENITDLGGKKFTFLTWWAAEYQGGKTATKDAQRCADALAQIQKDYNCKITIKAGGDLNTEIKNIATNKAAGKVYANIIDSFGGDGKLIDFKNGADLRNVKSVGLTTNQWNPVQTLVSSYKGAVYGVGVRYDRIEQEILFFNKVLAAKYNLGDFYDMVNKGQWTDDTFLQVCQKYQQETGGKAIVSNAMYVTHIFDLIYTNWTSPFGITEQKYIFNGNDDSVLNILGYLQTFCKDGLFDSTCSSADWKSDGTFVDIGTDYTPAVNKFNAGSSLFFIGSNGDAVIPYIEAQSKNAFGVIPLPKGPSADSYSTVITNVRYFSLLDGDPDIESSGALLTAIANRTNIKTSDIVANNSTLVRDSQSLENLTNNYKYKQILSVRFANAGNLLDVFDGAALHCVLKQETTPKQAMDSIANKAQALVDQYYGQS